MVLQQRLPRGQLVRLGDDVGGDLLELGVQGGDLVVQRRELALDRGDLLLDLAQDVGDFLVLRADRGELDLRVGERVVQPGGVCAKRRELHFLRAQLALQLRLLRLGVEDRIRCERSGPRLASDDQPSDRYQCHQAGGQT